MSEKNGTEIPGDASGGGEEERRGPAPVPGLPSRYRLEKTLGSGAFGVVYLAFDELLERRVCIKLLRPGREATLEAAQVRERFLREAQAAAKLKHPNIVTVHDAVECGEELAIVMEYVEGVTLRERLVQAGRLPFGEATAIASAVASGLDYAHEHGVIHRDIKPANVFLGRDGSVKVGDFGLAYMFDKPKLTSSGVVGTPAYMSPEQAQGRTLDRRSDVFSLGCLLYEMLTGEPPFAAPSIPTVLFKIVYEEPRPLPTLEPNLPAFLEGVVARALAKEPRERYQRAAELAADLDGLTTARTPVLRVRPVRRPFRWALGGLGLAAVGVAVVGLVLLLHTPRRTFLAVLPFENRTGEPEFAFVARGLPAEIARQFAEESSVAVVPASDVLEQLGRGLPLREAGRQAGAAYVLGGSIEAKGEALSIAASLLDTRRDRISTVKMPASLSDLQRPVTELRAQTLAWLGLKPSATPATLDPRAFELYLKGTAKIDDMQMGKGEAFGEGKALLERALSIEPSVEIYSGLAQLHFEAVNEGANPTRANLDLCHYYLDKGLALKPDYLPLLETGMLLAIEEGRMEDALKIGASQLLADRLSAPLLGRVGNVLRHNGDYTLAEAFYRLSTKLFPQDFLIKSNLYRSLFDAGRREEALTLMRELVHDNPERMWPRIFVAQYALLLGDTREARRVAATLPAILPVQLLDYQIARAEGNRTPFGPGPRALEQAELDFDTCLLLAENYSLSGDVPSSLRYLGKTLDLGWWAWSYFDRDPPLENLRRSEDYQHLRAEGLERQRQRREHERAILRPVLAKLGITASE